MTDPNIPPRRGANPWAWIIGLVVVLLVLWLLVVMSREGDEPVPLTEPAAISSPALVAHGGVSAVAPA